MTTPGMIIQPPRTFAMVMHFAFDADTRSDAELADAILKGVTCTLDMGRFSRGAQVARTASLPVQGTSQ